MRSGAQKPDLGPEGEKESSGLRIIPDIFRKNWARRLEKRSRHASRESDKEGKEAQRQTSPGARWEDQPGPAMETHSQTQALSSACGHQGSSPPFVPVAVTQHEPSGKWETNHPLASCCRSLSLEPKASPQRMGPKLAQGGSQSGKNHGKRGLYPDMHENMHS